jgi:signal peptidase II
MKAQNRLLATIGAAGFIGDQLMKQAIVARMHSGEGVSTPLRLLSLHHHHNRVAAYGSLAGLDDAYRVPLLVLLPSAILVALLWAVRRLDESERMLALALALVVGGALSNLFDRAARGHVIDFLRLDWGSFHSAVYNLADLFIFAGFALLAARAFATLQSTKEA